MLPISLLITSWSFTKDVEQITLRLYLWYVYICIYGCISHPSVSLISEHNILEKTQYFTCSTEISISGILKCLLAPTVSESWIFYRTCLKASQKQVFFNDLPLFKCLTKFRKIKGGRRLPVLPFTLKEVTPIIFI